MEYHIFKKPTKSKNKIVHRWYYYYVDPFTGKKVQKVCKNCRTQAEANAYISQLSSPFEEKKICIKDITNYMFIPGSAHMERMEKFGRKLDIKTIKDKRHLLDIFVSKFGDTLLQDLTVPKVIDFLFSFGDKRSGSWKNNMLTVIGEVFDEAPFYGLTNIKRPSFPKFARNSKKKDIFTTDELQRIFDENNWIKLEQQKYSHQPMFKEDYTPLYLMFLTCITCGLRLGEAIGVKVNQFLFDDGIFLVNGFYKHESKIRTTFNKCGSDEDKKLRVVPLSDALNIRMRKYVQEHNLTDEDYVFTRYGAPINKKLAENWFSHILTIAGIEKDGRTLTPHSLRFTYVTRMRRMESGETVKKLAGHTSIVMTDYYTRAEIPEMCKALQPVKEAVNGLFE
ncbi:tyrosine-type recombinase/integrase [Treponema sp.]|uniref:tyrosine-type recombinase/integrase n=1 Tax=Treponema sp. TaxID=166 RepID=UPI00298E6A5A|nr:tyrosine-type recombinase/integrase [Treponema sp.]MCR5613497.1 site-specific integrase [Treponema sp.]